MNDLDKARVAAIDRSNRARRLTPVKHEPVWVRHEREVHEAYARGYLAGIRAAAQGTEPTGSPNPPGSSESQAHTEGSIPGDGPQD